MNRWILPLALLALVVAALPVLALSSGRLDPFGQDVTEQPPAHADASPTPVEPPVRSDEGIAPAEQPPVRSDEGIAPDECSRVHNVAACERQAPSPGPPSSNGGSGRTPPRPDPVAEPPEGMVRSPAPIDGVDVAVQESFPVQYLARVDYGLPNGCARPGGYAVERNGSQIEVAVWILLPADPNVVCTMIYGLAHHDIPLDGEFESGQTYTLTVNGTTSTTFTAQ